MEVLKGISFVTFCVFFVPVTVFGMIVYIAGVVYVNAKYLR
jgi:hypothetical protein